MRRLPVPIVKRAATPNYFGADIHPLRRDEVRSDVTTTKRIHVTDSAMARVARKADVPVQVQSTWVRGALAIRRLSQCVVAQFMPGCVHCAVESCEPLLEHTRRTMACEARLPNGARGAGAPTSRAIREDRGRLVRRRSPVAGRRACPSRTITSGGRKAPL